MGRRRTISIEHAYEKYPLAKIVGVIMPTPPARVYEQRPDETIEKLVNNYVDLWNVSTKSFACAMVWDNSRYSAFCLQSKQSQDYQAAYIEVHKKRLILSYTPHDITAHLFDGPTRQTAETFAHAQDYVRNLRKVLLPEEQFTCG